VTRRYLPTPVSLALAALVVVVGGAVLATCGAFAEVLAVDVGVSLPSTGAGGASSDTSNWLLLAAGLAALGLGVLSLRMRRA